MVRLYMDDSGEENDPNTPHAVLGGMLINYSHYLRFEQAWDEMLDRHGMQAPLHMKEFGRDGRFGKMSHCCRRELFEEAVDLIMSHRIAGIAATITSADYRAYMPEEARKVFSIYATCFIVAVVINHKLALGRYAQRIPYVLDAGNPNAEHVRIAHKELLLWQKEGHFFHAGGLYFDDDAEFGTLQAADIIAWATRRRAHGKRFPRGMEPIEALFPAGHNEPEISRKLLKQLGDNLRGDIEVWKEQRMTNLE